MWGDKFNVMCSSGKLYFACEKFVFNNVIFIQSLSRIIDLKNTGCWLCVIGCAEPHEQQEHSHCCKEMKNKCFSFTFLLREKYQVVSRCPWVLFSSNVSVTHFTVYPIHWYLYCCILPQCQHWPPHIDPLFFLLFNIIKISLNYTVTHSTFICLALSCCFLGVSLPLTHITSY